MSRFPDACPLPGRGCLVSPGYRAQGVCVWRAGVQAAGINRTQVCVVPTALGFLVAAGGAACESDSSKKSNWSVWGQEKDALRRLLKNAGPAAEAGGNRNPRSRRTCFSPGTGCGSSGTRKRETGGPSGAPGRRRRRDRHFSHPERGARARPQGRIRSRAAGRPGAARSRSPRSRRCPRGPGHSRGPARVPRRPLRTRVAGRGSNLLNMLASWEPLTLPSG